VPTIAELMTPTPAWVGASWPLIDAARRMRDLEVGTLPILGPGQRLVGMLSDRDIVVRCVAAGADPAVVHAGDLARGTPAVVQATAPAETALHLMARHRVRRLPVVDGDALVGIVAQADVARALPVAAVGRVLAEVSTS